MHSGKILTSTLFTSVLFLGLHTTASAHAWYFHFWWFDILMHTLGGLILGLVGFWFFIRLGYAGSDRSLFLKVLLGVLVIAIGWEIFEFQYDIYGKGNYVLDTTLDLIMAVIGMYLGGKIVLRSMRRLLPSKNVISKQQGK